MGKLEPGLGRSISFGKCEPWKIQSNAENGEKFMFYLTVFEKESQTGCDSFCGGYYRILGQTSQQILYLQGDR